MPYPFVLPTTSAFSFSASFNCESHPSLPLHASTHRGVVRDTLKAHKRLAPSSQAANISSVVSSLTSYLPYLFAVDAGLGRRAIHNEEINVILKSAPAIEWRATLASDITNIYNINNKTPGTSLPHHLLPPSRVLITSLEYEISFALATLANAYTRAARNALHPLYLTSSAPVGTAQRQAAVKAATANLLDAAAIYAYLSARATSTSSLRPPCADIAQTTLRAQSELALAEATLLAVLKDDPYPAVVAADRNKHDTEWMYKAPEIPKVRANLYARLCLAASEHAAQAHSLCAAAGGRAVGGGSGGGKIDQGFIKYLEDLRRTSRARACRFFGIDSELGGQTGEAIAWLHVGLRELGVERKEEAGGGKTKSAGGLSRLKKEWSEKREDRKVEKGAGGGWGGDAGKLEETRIIEMLEGKWVKENDTMFTQPIAPTGTLLAQMPSGREIHTLKPYQPPMLDSSVLEAMRAPPDREEDAAAGGGGYVSSDEETLVENRSGRAGAGTPSYY
ncbi:hypothetical protein B0T17DRAFT_509475 [Bombardia bombarda]|uniref:pH-response regulator protein palC n=1 Tax=Bombardia bombarda TaxID=252184 RepID=A0AA40BY55_9PEZI|nr:hypothetical protein B0T17DRAFT_509475 [Bombardia bombarda]